MKNSLVGNLLLVCVLALAGQSLGQEIPSSSPLPSIAGLSGHLSADCSSNRWTGIVVNSASQRTPRGYDLIHGAIGMASLPSITAEV